MSGPLTAKKVVSHPYFAMLCVISLFFVLMPYSITAGMVGCASVLSVYVAVLPEHFRSRSGSLLTATCLVAAMWVAAAVITALTVLGELRG
jgi:hypothetical protein